MKKTAAALAAYALEQIGVRWTFGIPGVHNTELYDELHKSASITPILVTHEGGAAFMADAVSRVSGSIGTLVIVPAAGLTHAASGIGEAMLDGIPMLVISGGVRNDTGRAYQLHDIDQLVIAKGLTKAAFRVTRHEDVVATLFEAYRIATSGEPGPVLVEIPANLLLFTGDVPDTLPTWTPPPAPQATVGDTIRAAVDLLAQAKRPGIFVGWGAREAVNETAAIAELLQAPVATTLQGLAAFPADHPLHTGFSFGNSAVPAAKNAFADCDALLAVGARFGEIATGSYGVTVPPALVHIDINPTVFNANYPARIAIEGDARAVLAALLAELQARPAKPANNALIDQIVRDKAAYRQAWLDHDSQGRVNPLRFFDALRRQMPADATMVVDDGNHTYLTAELFPVQRGGRLIVPTDFNAMGYAVPAAIGARLSAPEHEVFAIVGDGAFAMTCMELLTATRNGLGLVVFVFNDGELSQIAQAQEIPYGRKPCTALGVADFAGIAQGVGAAYVAIANDAACDAAVAEARRLAATGRPVIVDVTIDYSKRTAFTEGTVKTNFARFPFRQKLRFVARAMKRKLLG